MCTLYPLCLLLCFSPSSKVGSFASFFFFCLPLPMFVLVPKCYSKPPYVCLSLNSFSSHGSHRGVLVTCSSRGKCKFCARVLFLVLFPGFHALVSPGLRSSFHLDYLTCNPIRSTNSTNRLPRLSSLSSSLSSALPPFLFNSSRLTLFLSLQPVHLVSFWAVRHCVF
ncbi:hypothetical protein LY78DRAFT_112552 [Colletotrichum sublineola]|nr:hypothetical protein LY78DRAFT_112552 [Colletotrichum sublineola]